MVLSTNLGFPRVGVNRELKKAVEAYWKGNLSKEALKETSRELRMRHWQMQKESGIDQIPSHDFCMYDHVLSMAATLGCVPPRFKWDGGSVGNDLYFAMARGAEGIAAMEMTKWFDTNYHYIVPEFEKDQDFKLSCEHIFHAYEEAKAAGVETKPVLVGPLTFLLLGKARGDFCVSTLLDKILPVYEEILSRLHEMGVSWVQIDEPALLLDLPDWAKDAYKPAYERLKNAAPGLNVFLATYFGDLGDNMEIALSLPVQAVHLDLVRAPEQYKDALAFIPEGMSLSLGLIDGRNIWKNDLSASLKIAEDVVTHIGSERVMVGPSCSLLHSPIDLDVETELDADIKNWLAFAKQKLDEIAALAKGVNEGRDSITGALADSDAVVADRKSSARIHNAAVKSRIAAIVPDMFDRVSPFAKRAPLQHEALGQPLFPTTTIGSFPQTPEIRKARADFKKGEMDLAAYETSMKKEIEAVVRFQEEIDLDVLVHGEPERNDMVEYFGEQLSGFAFTKNGWVQSYGSRCVKPPIIYGDVSRPDPMTVEWSKYAQSLTAKPMKGMLTGPVTILQWSFVRNDQSRSKTCNQIALALRDEVADLEAAGITSIQMDEPAIREGLPLRRGEWDAYLEWAVNAFRLSVAVAKDTTQIHTHMCYSEFNDMIEAIGAMDADVISIESSRSHMELLEAFETYHYPNEIGPGVYDIHSPRVPSVEEQVELLEAALSHIPAKQLWVNPDCGLKTRGWAEVEPSLKNMVDAAKAMRAKAEKEKAA
ncbi:MAG: 5-methyltetrahydropteroyltriglutamate--homocysteine S-methyltransferase [Rhodospirillales bacterium]|nr:5-methyltetrahydropteroyltriglutamate--homocysteine S-methyltransferase [Rhodospirillales bacterium]